MEFDKPILKIHRELKWAQYIAKRIPKVKSWGQSPGTCTAPYQDLQNEIIVIKIMLY